MAKFLYLIEIIGGLVIIGWASVRIWRTLFGRREEVLEELHEAKEDLARSKLKDQIKKLRKEAK